MRKIKVLGLMLVAMFAMSAVAATAASADEFTAEKYPVTLTGLKDTGITDEFNTTTGVVKCATPTYHGTVSGPTTTVEVTPSYHECTAFGFPATVDSSKCHFLFHIGAGTSTKVTSTLICTEGGEVTVTATSGGTPKCIVHVPSQTVEGEITLKNIGSGSTQEITLSGTVGGIDYTHTKGTGLGACAAGSAGNGTLTAGGIVTGETDPPGGGHIGIFLSNA